MHARKKIDQEFLIYWIGFYCRFDKDYYFQMRVIVDDMILNFDGSLALGKCGTWFAFARLSGNLLPKSPHYHPGFFDVWEFDILDLPG